MVDRLPEEARARHRADTDLSGQLLAELQIAVIAEFGNVHHHIIRPLRYVVDKAQSVQALAEQIALVRVFCQQVIVIVLAESQSRDDGLLQGSRRADGQEVVYLLGALNDGRGRNDVAQPPARDRVGLGQRRAGDRPLPHIGQRGKIGVGVRRVDDVLVHLVGDNIDIILFGKARNQLQLVPGEHLAAGVRGVAQDQRLRVLAEGILQYLGVKGKFWRRQRHINWLCPGQDRIRAVVLVKRREDNDLVPRVRHGHHGGHHRLGAAAGHNDLTVGVNCPAHIAGLLGGQRLTEVLRAPGDGVLVVVLVRDLGQTVQNCFGRVKIREALGKVHCAVLVGDTGHAADDGIGKACGAVRKRLHW